MLFRSVARPRLTADPRVDVIEHEVARSALFCALCKHSSNRDGVSTAQFAQLPCEFLVFFHYSQSTLNRLENIRPAFPAEIPSYNRPVEEQNRPLRLLLPAR